MGGLLSLIVFFFVIVWVHLIAGLILRVPFAIIGCRAWFEKVWWYFLPFKWFAPSSFSKFKNIEIGLDSHSQPNYDTTPKPLDTNNNFLNDLHTSSTYCNVPGNTSYNTIGAGSIKNN